MTRDCKQQPNEGARLRQEAMQSQMALGFTMCDLAAQSIVAGHFAHAQKAVERLWRSAHTLSRHVDEPRHVPPSAIPELRAEVQRLEGRITEVQAQLLQAQGK